MVIKELNFPYVWTSSWEQRRELSVPENSLCLTTKYLRCIRRGFSTLTFKNRCFKPRFLCLFPSVAEWWFYGDIYDIHPSEYRARQIWAPSPLLLKVLAEVVLVDSWEILWASFLVTPIMVDEFLHWCLYIPSFKWDWQSLCILSIPCRECLNFWELFLVYSVPSISVSQEVSEISLSLLSWSSFLVHPLCPLSLVPLSIVSSSWSP